MEIANFLVRIVISVSIGLALYLSRRVSGPGVFNIPYWNGIGIFSSIFHIVR